jgi:hypothetical protein
MPYQLGFIKQLPIADQSQYINPCCTGCDLVIGHLLPFIRECYRDVDSGQEDWGWYAWFREGDVQLAVDANCQDVATGEFMIVLTSRVPRRFFGAKEVDTPQLDALRALVVERLAAWPVEGLAVQSMP